MADNTDFNDLAAAEGLAAVKETVNKAVDAAQGVPFGAYIVRADGVYWTPPPTKNDPDPEPRFFCSRLAPQGIARTVAGEHFALVFEMTDADGREKSWPLSWEAVERAGGEEARCTFARLGGYFGPGIRANRAFTDFLASIKRYARRNLPRLTLTDRCGWIVAGEHRAFVLPCETLGTLGSEKVILSAGGDTPPDFASAGTVADWQAQIGRYCSGNARLLFAASLTMAAPLLHPLGAEGGGFHFVGHSSIGKTTLHHVAASVAGPPGDFVKSCNATSNAFEAVAALHNDGVLLMDELGEASPEQIGGIVYKLAGGIGRGRADHAGNARERRSWRVLFATTGETDLATMTKSTGRRTFAGQELRLCDIPADAGKGLGVFETLHDCSTPAELADHLRSAAGRVHGSVLREYLRRLVAELTDAKQRGERLRWLQGCRSAFVNAAVPAGASGQVQRAAGRFSLVAAGGELATHYGLTGWLSGASSEAALTCFAAWLDRRGTAGQGETDQLLRQVAWFFELHGESRFAPMGNNTPDKGRPTPNRAGFKRLVTAVPSELHIWEFFVLPEAFKELVNGFDTRWASALLIDKGLLKPDSDGKAQSRHHLPGLGTVRCYHFPANFSGSAILERQDGQDCHHVDI